MSQPRMNARTMPKLAERFADLAATGREDIDGTSGTSAFATSLAAGRTGLITLLTAGLLVIFTAIAFSGESEKSGDVAALSAGASEFSPSTTGLPTLPPIDAIDARTDITVFLQTGVPHLLRDAALRRAWTMDPAIRDFKGLQENDWNFEEPNRIPGFGELGPETNVSQMLAQLFSNEQQTEIRPLRFSRRIVETFTLRFNAEQ